MYLSHRTSDITLSPHKIVCFLFALLRADLTGFLRWLQCAPGQKGKCSKRKMERYRAIFGASSNSRTDFISAFEAHNNNVRQFFKEELNQPHRLLDIDLTKNKDHGNGVSWKIFCNFVGH